jgi:hypothetical protein
MIDSTLRKQIKTKQQEYLLLKAAIMAAEEIEEENKVKILKENVFIDDEGVRVTDPGEDWLIEDTSFIRYLKMVAEENRKAGLKVNNYDEVIALEEKEALKKVENELLELQLRITPANIIENIKKAQQHWKYREECLDLILRLAV